MSKIVLESNAAGTGTFSIASPATNTNRALTLPDETGTVLTSVSAISSAQITGALSASGFAPIYACRAWVNFNGTGFVAIRASGNVSSITDNGVGDYTVNFTTAMPDANYCAQVTKEPSASLADNVTYDARSVSTALLVRVLTAEANVLADSINVNVSIFR